MICKDGRTIDVMLSAIAERDETGRVVRSQAVLLDVTERLRIERALQESEARYRDLVELSPDGVAVLRDGRFLYLNKAGAQTLGYEDPRALLGREIAEFVAPAAREGLRARVARIEATRGVVKAQGEAFVTRDGQVVRVETVGAPALQLVFRDVTERQHAEETARRSVMQEELIRAQQDMLQALSTPLVPLGEGMILMPLVGSVDRARAEQIRAALLVGVQAHRAEVVILDVTGVPAMDGAVGEAIVGAARAAKLLGTQVFVTGLSPAAARTLVTLGVDLGGIVTHAQVRDGLAAARRRIEQSASRRTSRLV
jgi:rsbT co-antagonist protein RsbR